MSMMEAVFKKQRKAFEKQVEEQNRGYRKPQKINIERNIQYGEDKRQTFDMIYPTDAKPDIPVIINIHGGGLVMGDKDFNTRFNIRMAQNGYLVISVNYRLVPDVTVFEQMQDVIDGIEAARQIRALDRADVKELPIIAMTANAFEEDKREAIAAGMNEHIAKPVQADKLLSILSEVIRQQEKY